MSFIVRSIVACTVAFVLINTPSTAQELTPKQLGQAVLDVSGTNTAENCGVKFRFTRAMLLSLPQTEFSTTTIWTDKSVTFKGVPLLDVINATGLSGTEITAWAINDYMAMYQVDDDITQNALIAITLDGQPMHARDKGPLWIVFPYDSHDKFRTEAVYAQSIWQLDRLEIN